MKTRQAPLYTPTYAHSLWRKGCHLSVPLGTLISKDTTSESTPGHTVREHRPGASPTTKGHDRLVHRIRRNADTRPSICPLCGLTADNAVTVQSELTATATYCDTAGHLWAVTWAEVA
jgi:hypothetical protein